MTQYKDQGNFYYKQNDTDKAVAKWQKAIKLIPYDANFSEEEQAKKAVVAVACHSNLSTLWAKSKDWDKVMTDTTEALKLQPNHVKSLYRQAQAFAASDRFAEAEKNITLAKQLEPANAELDKELQAIRNKKKAIADREKKVFGGWFNKVNIVTDAELAEINAREEAQKARDAKKTGNGDGEGMDSDSDEEDGAPVGDVHGHGGDSGAPDAGHGHSHGGVACGGHGGAPAADSTEAAPVAEVPVTDAAPVDAAPVVEAAQPSA